MIIKKILFAFVLFITLENSLFAITEEELKSYTYIDFYNFITSYNARKKNIVNGAFNEKKIDITGSFFITYIEPAEKYVTYLEYRGAPRKIDTYQKPFLLDWFKISNNAKGYKMDDTAESILVDENFGLFYTSTMYSTRGRTYFITTQKAINDEMEKQLRIGELIRVYIWNLGQYNSDIPTFVVIGFEKSPKITDAIKAGMYFQQYFPVLRDDIFNRRYDKAKGNIELLLKKYPDNVDLKLNLCLIFNQTNFFAKSISCYQDVLKVNPRNYDAYYGLSMAYYNNKQMNEKSKMQLIVENTTKSLDIIQSVSPEPRGSLAMIAFNCHYLRAMAKLSLGDKTAIDDLLIVNKSQPTLVSSDTIDIFKKKLGL